MSDRILVVFLLYTFIIFLYVKMWKDDIKFPPFRKHEVKSIQRTVIVVEVLIWIVPLSIFLQ